MPNPAQAGGSRLVDVAQQALTWAYGAALHGGPGIGSLCDFSRSYLEQSDNADEAIKRLVRWQVAQAGTVGFVSGLGGFITLPAAIPANIATVSFLQLRMVAAIAEIRGYDVHSDQVKTLCLACLAGSAVADVLKDAGIRMGAKATQQVIGRISGATLVRINQTVGFRLVTKAGSTGIVSLTKVVPFIGGFIGGAFDAATTRAIAHAAKTLFTTVDRTAGTVAPTGAQKEGVPSTGPQIGGVAPTGVQIEGEAEPIA